MGRAERRRAERKSRIESRKNQVSMTYQELGEMKEEIMTDASKLNVEALMTCFALAERRLYGFGPKRVLRSLQYIDDLMGDILNGEATIRDYQKQLEEELSIKVKC